MPDSTQLSVKRKYTETNTQCKMQYRSYMYKYISIYVCQAMI